LRSQTITLTTSSKIFGSASVSMYPNDDNAGFLFFDLLLQLTDTSGTVVAETSYLRSTAMPRNSQNTSMNPIALAQVLQTPLTLRGPTPVDYVAPPGTYTLTLLGRAFNGAAGLGGASMSYLLVGTN
jgi:hypothetical protein